MAVRVVQEPSITFTCDSCKAVNEGDPEDFALENTKPPTWTVRCAFCHGLNRCSPPPLIARLVGRGI